MSTVNYIFQSPYSSPIQVGRPDPSTTQKDETSTNKKQETPVVSKTIGEILQDGTQSLPKAKPTVTNGLDTYA